MAAKQQRTSTVEAWWEREAHQQTITNELPIPPRRAQIDAPEPIPVIARIEWAHDGEEQLDTKAIAWTSQAVLVLISDRRRRTIGAWLPPGDVARR